MKILKSFYQFSRTRLSKALGSKEERTSRISNTTSESRTQLTLRFAKSIGRVWGSDPKQANAARAAGDTIIEVLVSIAVMGIVLAGGYGIANRTLSTGQSADKRTKALATAQSQIEFIINAQNAGGTAISNYTKQTADFCILADGSNTKPADTTPCKSYNGQPYSVAIKYLNNLFTVTTVWASTTSNNNQDQLKLYYKLPGNYIALNPPPAPLPPPGPGPAPPPPPPAGSSPPQAGELPTYDIRVQPYTTESTDPASCYMYAWLYFKGPTLQRTNMKVSGPGSQDEWWTLHSFKVPTNKDWPPDSWGSSIYNWHNRSGDVGWDWGDPVSAVHFFFKSLTANASNPSSTGLVFALEQAFYSKQMPDPKPGEWYDIVTHIIFGRNDGTTARPGAAQVWINGNSTPVVDLKNINVLQKAVNPKTGRTEVQRTITYWDGGPYIKGEPCRGIGALQYRHLVATTRFGTTLPEAINDTNIKLEEPTGYTASVHIPGQPNYGDSTVNQVTPGSADARKLSDFKLPPGL